MFLLYHVCYTNFNTYLTKIYKNFFNLYNNTTLRKNLYLLIGKYYFIQIFCSTKIQKTLKLSIINPCQSSDFIVQFHSLIYHTT